MSEKKKVIALKRLNKDKLLNISYIGENKLTVKIGQSCKNWCFYSQTAWLLSLTTWSTFKKPKLEVRDDEFLECFIFDIFMYYFL